MLLSLMHCLVILQAICNSLWSYSKLGYNPGHRVLDIAARRAAVMLHQYTSQEIANTLWAFATLEQNPGAGMLDAAAMQISRRIEQFSPQVRPRQTQPLVRHGTLYLLTQHYHACGLCSQ